MKNRLTDRLFKGPYLESTSSAFALLVPVFIIGSIVVLALNFPLPGYAEYMEESFGADWKDSVMIIYELTFGLMGLFISGSIAYSLSIHKFDEENTAYIVGVISMIGFLLNSYRGQHGIDFNVTGPATILTGIIISVISYNIFLLTRKIVSKVAIKPIMFLNHAAGASFNAIIPSIVTIFILWKLRNLTFLISDNFIHDVFSSCLSNIITELGSGYIVTMFTTFFMQLSWFFGVHGDNLIAESIYPVMDSSYAALVTEGVRAEYLFNKPFMDTFVHLGGSGATLSLLIAIFIAKGKGTTKRVAMAGLIPSLFNVNEILIFGLPIVLNPYLLIPFILVPMVMGTISFLAISTGLIPPAIYPAEWTTPALISGYIRTGSILGSLLQLICIVIGVFLYLPFVKKYDTFQNKKVDTYLKTLTRKLASGEFVTISDIVKESKQLGVFLIQLGKELQYAITHGHLHMVYQPLVDKSGRIYGFESLLRWKHDIYGYISPLVIVTTAEYTGKMVILGDWINQTALSQARVFQKEGKHPISISINVTPTQLQKADFFEKLETLRKSNQLDHKYIILEVTESTHMTNKEMYINSITKLQAEGYQIAIDDFGMGYTSLSAIRNNQANIIKLDGTLTTDIHKDTTLSKTVKVVVDMGKALNCKIVAEFIEGKEQRDHLISLGCSYFQGYYCSKPLLPDQAIEVVRNGKIMCCEGSDR